MHDIHTPTVAAGDTAGPGSGDVKEELLAELTALAGGDASVSGEATTAGGGAVGDSGDEDSGADDEEAAEDAGAELPLDVVFDILKNERRRLVLRYLREHEGPATIGELAEHIAAYENDKTVEALSSDERKRAYVGLYQCHFPKMEDAGVIDSDRNLGVSLGSNADRVFDYLDRNQDEGGRDWTRIHAGLATAALPIYLGQLLVPASVEVAFQAGLGVVLVGFALAAVAHAAEERRDGDED